MNKFFLVILFSCFQFGFLFSQNDLFPIAKNGKWGLIKRDGSFVLQPIYDYIEYQTAGQKFIYDHRGKFGALDEKGMVLSPPFFEYIWFFTPDLGAFQLNNKWRLFKQNEDILKKDFDTIEFVQDQLYQLTQKDTLLFYDAKTSATSERWYLEGLIEKDVLIADRKNGLKDLLTPTGLKTIVANITSLEWIDKRMAFVYFQSGVQLLNAPERKFVSEKYENITHQFDNWFVCKNGSNYFLFNVGTGKIYTIPEVDEIIDFSGNLLSYYKGGSIGVWNYVTGQEILPPTFEGAALQGGLIYTQQNGLFGIVTSSGNEIFPPIYSEISNYTNVYLLRKDGRAGLATPSGKEIEPCIYRKIEIYDKNVKCYDKNLTTISLDESGKVKDRTVYTEFMTVSFDKERMPRQSTQSLNFASSNESDKAKSENYKEGWFQTKFQREVNGVMKDIYGNWGMKNNKDSIVIRARYKEIELMYGTTYTFAFLEKRLKSLVGKNAMNRIMEKDLFYAIDKSIAVAPGWFHIVNHKGKFVLSNQKYLSVQIEDFNEYALARAVLKIPVLIDSSGNIAYSNLTFYDDYYDGHLRICEGGTQLPNKRLINGSTMSIDDFFDDMRFYSYEVDKKKPYFSIKGGKWFFIDRYGNKKNEQPFDFAFPFQNNRSIVARKGKWGVVDTNMIEIVKIDNQLVERIYSNGKTFFKVTNGHNQKYFYQRSESSYTETDYSEFSNYINGFWFVKHPKTLKWGVVDTTLNLVMDFTIDQVLARYGDLTTVLIDKKSYLLDKNIQIISPGFEGATGIVPLKHNRYKIETSERSFYVVDASGNVLIPPYTCSEIVASNEKHICYKDPNLNFKIWSETPITLPKKTILISGNPKNEILLLLKGKKYFLYSIKTSTIIGKPIKSVISLENEGYVFQNLEGKKGIVNYAGDTILQATYTEIKFNDKAWGVANISWDKFYLINEKGEKMYDQVFKKITAVSDYYLIEDENGTGLMNANAEFIFPCKFISINEYNYDYYRTTQTGKSTTYYTKNMEELTTTDRFDLKGTPLTGWVASVGKVKYFYDGYINKRLNFEEIIPLSTNSFILYEKWRVGVYGYEGDTVVPPIYHELKQDRDLFQVRFFNSFGYFDHFGKNLFDPKTGK